MTLIKSLQAILFSAVINLMYCHSAMAMQVLIDQSGSAQTLTVDIAPSDTVDALKTQISLLEAIPKAEQELHFMGTLLENNKTLASYSIQDKSNLILSRITVLRALPFNDASVHKQLSSHLRISRRFTQGQMNNIWQHINSLHQNFNVKNNKLLFGINANKYQQVYRMLKQVGYDLAINKHKNNSEAVSFIGSDKTIELASNYLYADILSDIPNVPDLGNKLDNHLSINDKYFKGLPVSLWGNGNIEFGSLDLKGNTQLFSSKGLTLGIDSQINDKLIIGTALGYGFSKDKLDKLGSATNSEQITASLYLSYFPNKNWSLDTLLGYANLSMDNQRQASTTEDRLKGDRDANISFASFSLNRVFNYEVYQLRSYVRGDITKVDFDSYNEANTNSALSYASVSTYSKSTSAGTEFLYHIPLKKGLITPSFNMKYTYQFNGNAHQDTYYSDLTAASKHYDLAIKSSPVSTVKIATALKYINSAGNSINLVYSALTGSNSYRKNQVNLNAKIVF